MSDLLVYELFLDAIKDHNFIQIAGVLEGKITATGAPL
jgi:hypothetical protein